MAALRAGRLLHARERRTRGGASGRLPPVADATSFGGVQTTAERRARWGDGRRDRGLHPPERGLRGHPGRDRGRRTGPRRVGRALASARHVRHALRAAAGGALGDVRSRGKLTEDDVDKAMRADPPRAARGRRQLPGGQAVHRRRQGAGARAPTCCESLNPGQQVVKIVSDELTELMGGSGRDLVFAPSRDHRDPDGRPPGLGQDDRLRQARAAPQGGARAGRRAWPPATSTARPRSSSW